jgi:glycosyltransferase involved in cell wall biosynthesis
MSKKIKIFFFHPYSKIGGADLSISNLINSLSTKDYDFNFICLDKQKISSYLNKKIKIYSIKKRRVSLSILDIRKIIKNNININQKTIFISNQYFANIIASISLFGLKNVKKIFLERNHINELFYYNDFFDFLKKKIIKFLLNPFYKYADLVICNSKLSATDLKKNISVPVKYIYNPTYLRKKFDKYKKDILYPYKYIINVSRFEKQKDHMTLLKSFKNIQQFTNYHLILIGYGSEEINIKNYIKNNFLEKYVKIIKNLKNALPYIKNAELFILTSVYEGLPNVIIESIALGTPVISSNCKSGPSEILLNGKGGDLFDQGDHDRLSEQIIAHYKNPNILKKKLLLSQKYLFRFDQNLISKKFDKVFRSI